MSFLSFCRGFGTFVSTMVEEKEATLILMQIKHKRVTTVIDDIYSCLELLHDHKPFNNTIDVAEDVALQEKFLIKVKYPDLVMVSGTLTPKWEVIKERTSYNGKCLTVRVSTYNGEIFDFIVGKKITVFCVDHNYCRMNHSIGECDNITSAFDMIFSDEVEAVMEDDEVEDEVVVSLKELPFNFKRQLNR